MYKLIFVFLLSFLGLQVQAQQKIEVFFDFNKSELNTLARAQLDSLFPYLQKYKITKIHGFCDAVDTYEYNDSLSLERVNTVVNYLKTKKIDSIEQIELKGFGEKFSLSEFPHKNRKATIFYKSIPLENKTEKKKESVTENKIVNAKVGEKLVLENLFFYNHQGVILPESLPVLKNLLQIMNSHPKLKIEIQGHICCQLVSDIGNISHARALTVYQYLIDNGINEKRLTYKAFGNKYPIYPIPEKTESQRITNRRVEIEIIEN